jgi:hypothetical protein
MKGLIRKAALALSCAIGAAGLGCETLPTTCGGGGCGGGCGGGAGAGLADATAGAGNGAPVCSNKNLYDRCYPQRYNSLARREVNLGFTPQVQNGHVLDQTIWNWHFEPGTDKLTPGGMYTLQYISRRRPCPDQTVYLATALDLPYDPHCPDRYCGARQELDSLRVAAIQKYLTGLNCGRPLDIQVLVHDPADPTISTIPASFSVLQMYARFRGGLLTGAGGQGGAAGPAAGVGGFGGAGGGAISTGGGIAPGR